VIFVERANACGWRRGGRGARQMPTTFQQRKPRSLRNSARAKTAERALIQLGTQVLLRWASSALPNAGQKAPCQRAFSRRTEKLPDYPFTTLVPNLGVVRRPNEMAPVFAESRGLIAGAALGAGLGQIFCATSSEPRLLVHLVDAGSPDWCRSGGGGRGAARLWPCASGTWGPGCWRLQQDRKLLDSEALE